MTTPAPAPEPTPAPPAADMEVLLDLAARFQAAKRADPALENVDLGPLLRHVPGKRAIMRSEFEGRPAVIRIYLDTPEYATRDWNELIRAWPHMKAGDARISQPLHHAPDHGIVIVEEVPGTPLFKHLWQSDPADRARYLAPAAAWLKQYAAPTEDAGRARWGRWMKMARRMAAKQPFARLRRIEAPIIAEMERIAPAMEAHDWRYAVLHGDFHPNNLILNETRLTGIDLGGSAMLPIYKDMARFLVHMGRRGMIPSGNRAFGVDQDGIAAFAGAFGLNESERALSLPFMIAVEALIRVENRGLKPVRIKQAREMYEALLEDLRGVRV